MIQQGKFLNNQKPHMQPTHKSNFLTNVSAELLWTLIIRREVVDIAWRKAIVTPSSPISEIEHQKMAFLQKLVEVVRKSSTAKLSTDRAENGQDVERSAKIAPDSSK